MHIEKKYIYQNILYRYTTGRTLLEGNEIHPYHEILYFIKGGGQCFTEQFDMKITDHTLFFIPKNTYHRFVVANQDEYTRLALTFQDDAYVSDIVTRLTGRVGVLSARDERLFPLLGKMQEALLTEQEELPLRRTLYGAFLLLISEISAKSCDLTAPTNINRALIEACTAYIDKHFTEDIGVEELAHAVGASASTVFTHFKKHLGISAGKYIQQRRMAHAHSLLSQGYLPTQIAFECGYHDYATFYKAYRKQFGCAPSQTEALNPLSTIMEHS